MRGAFLIGLLLAALLASSAVAWELDFAPALGQPLVWHLYDPLAIVGWARTWGLEPVYRRAFLSGLSTTLMLIVLPVLLVRLVDLYSPLKVGDRSPNLGLGTAQDLLRSGHIARHGGGVVIGRCGRHVLRDHGDGHVLIMGATRSGKGAGHVVPTLLTHTGSMLVLDPKHELAAIAGRHRRGLGAVHVLDPTSAASARFNPLLELRGGPHLYGDCQTAAHMLTHTGHGQAREDTFWDDATAYLLSALLVHVLTSADRTLSHLWRLAQEVDGGRYPTSQDPHVQRVIGGHRALEARVRSSINATMITRLQFLADPLVQAATAMSDVCASDLQADPDPLTMFLSIPVAHGARLRPLTRLVLQALLMPLMQDLHRTADDRAKRRTVLALLDEFPQLGRIDVLENGLAVCAGYGVRAVLVCQDEDQIRSIYGARQSITANCATLCVIPGFSGQSLETVARWGGDHTVAHAGKQRSLGLRNTPSLSESETKTSVLNIRDMIRRAKNEVLVFIAGCPPTYLPKVRYYQDRSFRGLFDDPTAPSPGSAAVVGSHADGEARAPWLMTHTGR
jgi:type IV secretion system protein VirD4